MTEAPKIKYHQFTGKFTQTPDPRDPKKMVDDKPIFAEYPGVVRGPFKILKPARMQQKNGVWECIDNGDLQYSNDVYEVTKAHGSGWQNRALKSWHLDVNFGTEYMPNIGYVEHALLKEDAMQFHGQRNYFEFVEAELVGAGANQESNKTQNDTPKKGK